MKKTPVILVADDEHRSRQMICAIIEKLGAKVVAAANGQEAVELFRSTPCDLVLLDVTMPKLDGFSACAQIRKLKQGKTVPILMVTSLADSRSVRKAASVGATDYITKPIRWAYLSELIEKLLGAPEISAVEE